MHTLKSVLVALAVSVAAVSGTSYASTNLDAYVKRSTTPGTASLGNVTCGTKTYSRRQVDEATAEGCRLYSEGQQIGNSKYPHKFNNREGLVFATSGPYQEFPIVSNGNYSGRSPGADRIVFDPNYKSDCVFVGAMTHTDAATRNGFVACELGEGKSQPSSSGSPSTSPTASGTGSAPSSTKTGSGASQIVALGVDGAVFGLVAWSFQLLL